MWLRAGLASLVCVASTAALAADTVRVCGLRFTSSGSYFIAMDKGYFKDEGIEVEPKFFDAAQPVAVAVSSGDCDIGITGLTAGLYNLAGKGALKVVAGEAWEEPGFNFIGYIASNKAYEAGLKKVTDLPKKRFGVSQLGSTFHYNVGMLATKYGWSDASVKIVPLQSVANMIAAVKSGQVDAVALPSFIASGLEKSGDAKVIGWVHEQTLWQVSMMIASTKMIENKALLERVLKAYRRGTAEYHKAFDTRDATGKRVFGPDADALIPILEKYTKASRQQIIEGTAFVDPDARVDTADIARQLAWYQGHGFVDKDVKPEQVIESSLVRSR